MPDDDKPDGEPSRSDRGSDKKRRRRRKRENDARDGKGRELTTLPDPPAEEEEAAATAETNGKAGAGLRRRLMQGAAGAAVVIIVGLGLYIAWPYLGARDEPAPTQRAVVGPADDDPFIEPPRLSDVQPARVAIDTSAEPSAAPAADAAPNGENTANAEPRDAAPALNGADVAAARSEGAAPREPDPAAAATNQDDALAEHANDDGASASSTASAAGEHAPSAGAATSDPADAALDEASRDRVDATAPEDAAPPSLETSVPAEPAAPDLAEDGPSAPAPTVTAGALADLVTRLERLEAAAMGPKTTPSEAAAATDAEEPAALAALIERVTALEKIARETPDARETLLRIERRISTLEVDREAAQLKAALDGWQAEKRALEAALTALSQEVATVSASAARQTADDARLIALVFAVGRLESTVAGGRAFVSELAAVKSVLADDAALQPALETLRGHAAGGVATLDRLRADFGQTATDVARSAHAATSDDWVDETVAEFRQLVTVRKRGAAADPESVDGRLIAAEAALGAGDLDGAIGILEGLARPARDGAARWLAAALAHRDAETALRQIGAHAAALVGARWSEGETAAQ